MPEGSIRIRKEGERYHNADVTTKLPAHVTDGTSREMGSWNALYVCYDITALV
jgi:hypothetical protein